jgi:hypothetical protein
MCNSIEFSSIKQCQLFQASIRLNHIAPALIIGTHNQVSIQKNKYGNNSLEFSTNSLQCPSIIIDGSLMVNYRGNNYNVTDLLQNLQTRVNSLSGVTIGAV